MDSMTKIYNCTFGDASLSALYEPVDQDFSVFKATWDDAGRVLIFSGCYTLNELEDIYDNWLDVQDVNPAFSEIARRGFEFAHFEMLQTGIHAKYRGDLPFAENYWRNHFGLL